MRAYSAFLPALSMIVLTSFSALGQANLDPTAERIWTGTNGATFRGTYARTLDLGAKIEFLTSTGKVVRVAIENLSKKDQEVIHGFEKKLQGKPETPASIEDDFKKLPAADRRLIPERVPKDFGGTDGEAMVDALWVSLLWWNAFEVMPIPKSGDFERKAEWLHKELTRYVGQSGSSASSLEEGKEGVEKYFEKRLEDTGACKVTIVQEGLNPGKLSGLITGNDIAVLRMSMTYENGKGRGYSICAALESVAADGAFALHFFGNRFTGKMVLTEATAKRPPHRQSYDLVLNDTQNLPKYFQDQEPLFQVIPGGWNGLLLVKPYVYKEPGKPVPLP